MHDPPCGGNEFLSRCRVALLPSAFPLLLGVSATRLLGVSGDRDPASTIFGGGGGLGAEPPRVLKISLHARANEFRQGIWWTGRCLGVCDLPVTIFGVPATLFLRFWASATLCFTICGRLRPPSYDLWVYGTLLLRFLGVEHEFCCLRTSSYAFWGVSDPGFTPQKLLGGLGKRQTRR